MGRIRPNVVAKILSPNRYHPRGQKPTLIVLHSTESSPNSGRAVAQYLAKPSTQASAHVIVDTNGSTYRGVNDGDAAWAQVAYNRPGLACEIVGRASQASWDPRQVKEVGRWIAQWSIKHDIPIRKAWTVGGRVIRSGVTTHAKLGPAGGNHSDPGTFPVGQAMTLAKDYKRRLT